MIVLRRHAWATDRSWERIESVDLHARGVRRFHPTAVTEWVACGFVYRAQGRVVAEIRTDPARIKEWIRWVEEPKQRNEGHGTGP